MATRSTIWMKNDDGTFKGVYCHWDGYLSNNGRILLDNYKDKEKVERLINLGSISYIEEEIDCPKGHSFNFPVKGYTVAYHRDRGEDLHQYNVNDLNEAISDYQEEYNYFFIDGKWFYVKYGDKELIELTENEIEND